MSEYLTEHWFASIIATIILGAIGSGLWDTAFKPATKWVGGALFTIVTLGAKRARNKIYEDASMGHHESPSIFILTILIAFLLAVVFSLTVKSYVDIYNPKLMTTDIRHCLEKEETNPTNCIHESIKDKVMPVLQLLTLLVVYTFVSFIYRLIKISKTNLITTYYEHCLKIIRPFLNEGEFIIFEQRYAMMKTKEEYDEIISNIEDIAKTNKIALPESYV